MKTLAYLDCPTGIAGDMCLGALVHAGVPLAYLQQQLAKLGIQNEFEIKAESVQRNQQVATKVHVNLLMDKHLAHTHEHSHHTHTDHEHTHTDHNHSNHPHDHSHAENTYTHHAHNSRKLPDIEALIQQANLPERATRWGLDIFRTLAAAEASVHGIPPEQVHFHEVGAVDAIVDIVGTCLGLDWLNIEALVCSPLPTGGGTVRCDHGLLPVPVPAVLSMMATAQVPVYSNGIEKELVTPTGCAIATTLAQSFGPPPAFTVQKIGLGAGGRDLAVPNILRLWIGTVGIGAAKTGTVTQTQSATHKIDKSIDESKNAPSANTESIVMLQTQLDDCSPQTIGYVFEQLFQVGAVDVFTQAITMKKNRLGTLLNVLCPTTAVTACETVLFRETTTLGIRRSQQTRSVLTREIVTVTTEYGDVPVKIARTHPDGKPLNLQPEHDDCARLARKHSLPLQQVHQAALSVATRKFQKI